MSLKPQPPREMPAEMAREEIFREPEPYDGQTRIQSPHDPIAITSSVESDQQALGEIQSRQAERDVSPGVRMADQSHASGATLVVSTDIGEDLMGPAPGDHSPQARLPKGITLDQFKVDLEQSRATCPGDHSTTNRSRFTEGGPQFKFDPERCATCPKRTRCRIIMTIVRQWREPTGRLGRLITIAMNRIHSRLTDWGLRHTEIEKHFIILDVGCGGGSTVAKLAKIATEGKVYGIDYSQESVRISNRTNKRLIEASRVEIRHGSVSSLPFSKDILNLVTAVNTHYYWPNLVADMQEVFRVLKPGGKLLIIGEAYKGGKYDERNRMFTELVNAANYSVNELYESFSTAGYLDVQIFEEYEKGWICGFGRKPI